jgi:outer membrane lipopolysaccharide assembly protein LptE/RlpB
MALLLNEKPLLEPETLFVERTYFQDIENISGNQEVAEIISAEMRRELINQMMRRLAAINSI